MNPLNAVDGYKTYIAAVGLAALAVYQFSIGDVPSAVQSVMAALAAAGLRNAISKSSPEAGKV